MAQTRKTWRRIFLFAAALVWCSSLCLATTWFEPDFETIVRESNLIAILQITDGGINRSKARVLDVLKGAAPDGEIEINGYNDLNWPQQALDIETLATGEGVLMFLFQNTENRAPAKNHSLTFSALADFRISRGKLCGGWLEVIYPHSKPPVDAKVAVELIRGYILQTSGAPPVAARKLLRDLLTVSNVVSLQLEKSADATAEKAWLLQGLLCAQTAYGETVNSNAVLQAAQSTNAIVRLCAARALPTAGNGEAVFAAAKKLVFDTNSFVQAEAARALTRGRFDKREVVPVLRDALKNSDPRGGGPANIMAPVQNRRASGRETIIRALTQLGAAP